MMFPRFYYPEKIDVDQVVELPANAMHHAVHVLRLEQGDKVTLFNGRGGEFMASVEQINKKSIFCLTKKYFNVERESPFHITLAQGICANAKMDWIIQKTVELGVGDIQPIATQRSLVKLSNERAEKRVRHWQQIATAACEQCGRNRLPQLFPPMLLSEWLDGQMRVQKKLSEDTSQNLFFILSAHSRKKIT